MGCAVHSVWELPHEGWAPLQHLGVQQHPSAAGVRGTRCTPVVVELKIWRGWVVVAWERLAAN